STTVCGTLFSCSATRGRSTCPKASVSGFIGVSCQADSLRAPTTWLSLLSSIGIIPADHEWHRAKPDGRDAEPGDHGNVLPRIDVRGASTGRLGVRTASLARISDGSGIAWCLHDFGMHLRRLI